MSKIIHGRPVIITIDNGPKFSAHFHQWADQPIKDEFGYVQCTMGLVEGLDGAVHMIHPSCIRFTDVNDSRYVMGKGAKILVRVNNAWSVNQPSANHLLNLIKDTIDTIGLDVQFAHNLEHLLNRNKLHVDACYVALISNFTEILNDEDGKFNLLRKLLDDNPGVTIILMTPAVEGYVNSERLQVIMDRTIQIEI